jgi:hypothetical protein
VVELWGLVLDEQAPHAGEVSEREDERTAAVF